MLGLFFQLALGLAYFLLLFLSYPIQWSLLCGLHSLLPPVHLLSPNWLLSHLPHKTWVPLPPPENGPKHLQCMYVISNRHKDLLTKYLFLLPFNM